MKLYEDFLKTQVIRNPDDTDDGLNKNSITIQEFKNINEETQRNINFKNYDDFQKNKTPKNINEEYQMLQKNQNLKNNNNPSMSIQFYNKNPKQNQTNLNSLPLQSNTFEKTRNNNDCNKNKEIENAIKRIIQ